MLADGSVRCWGESRNGVLGYAGPERIGEDEHPSEAPSLRIGATTVGIAAGAEHTCAVRDDGYVICWGVGADGRLGYASSRWVEQNVGDDEHPSTPGVVNLGSGVRAISAGGAHTCAITADGRVRCWGLGSNGRLGYNATWSLANNAGEYPGSQSPVRLGTGREATRIVTGASHTCARLDDGSLRCWGAGRDGRLGLGDVRDIGNNEHPSAAAPVNLGAGRYGNLLAAGGDHTCTAMDDGRIRCWGLSDVGQLGNGTSTTIGDNEDPSVATRLRDHLPDVVAMSAGADHTCALFGDATVRCWGSGASGRLGYGGTKNLGAEQDISVLAPLELLPAG